MKPKRGPAPLALALFATVAGTACSDGTGPDEPSSVSLSVAQAPAGGAAQPAAASAGMSFSDGSNTLDLSRVALVLRKVKLERATELDCDNSGTGSDPACEEFVAGPQLLEIPVDGTVDQVVSIDIPPDTYDELEFEVHKPSDDTAEDQAFLDANPDFADVSIRVEGSYNAEAFVFLQDLNEKQELELVPALVIEAGAGPTNVTLRVDVSTWFRDAAGALVDPRTANKGGENENLVENNIRASIEVFEDTDRDGSR